MHRFNNGSRGSVTYDLLENQFWLQTMMVLGAECRFRHQFAAAGDYVVEIKDSGYASGGSYHLRIGDFPLISHCFPLAVKRGEAVDDQVFRPLGFSTVSAAGNCVAGCRLRYEGRQVFLFTSRTSQASAWQSVHVSSSPQYVEGEGEGEEGSSLSGPTPLASMGRWTAAGEQDEYVIQGVKDETVRFRSKTRSLGSAALLKMQLVKCIKGKWLQRQRSRMRTNGALTTNFQSDGAYRLQASDLLGRGGEGFGYLVEVLQAGRVELTLKS